MKQVNKKVLCQYWEILIINVFRVLLRIIQTLRSHSRTVRDTGREILLKSTNLLGASYLLMVIKEIHSVLQRGYQLHILGYSLHSLLQGANPDILSSDMDACLNDVMEVGFIFI